MSLIDKILVTFLGLCAGAVFIGVFVATAFVLSEVFVKAITWGAS